METTAQARPVAIRSMRKPLKSLGLWIALLPLGLITVLPLIYMLSQSFTAESETMLWPIHWIPPHPTISNFMRIFQDPTLPVLRWFGNSMVVAICITALVLFLSSLAAYGYARLEFPGRDTLFFILIFSLMIPAAV